MTTGACLLMAAGNSLEPGEFMAAYLVFALVVTCHLLVLSSGARLPLFAIPVGLVVLAELLGSGCKADELDPAFIPYSLILSASSSLVFSLRRTPASVIFTALAFVLVLAYSAAAAVATGVKPIAALVVVVSWTIMFLVRLSRPRALALYGGFRCPPGVRRRAHRGATPTQCRSLERAPPARHCAARAHGDSSARGGSVPRRAGGNARRRQLLGSDEADPAGSL
ncbi:hypothetical protein AB6813_07750 [bacterium RCC_150]